MIFITRHPQLYHDWRSFSIDWQKLRVHLARRTWDTTRYVALRTTIAPFAELRLARTSKKEAGVVTARRHRQPSHDLRYSMLN